MKHKTIKVLTVGCLALACIGLSSCESTTTIENPWTEYFTLNAAKSHSDFSLNNVPDSFEGESITYVGYLSSMNMSQVIYGEDYCVIRKAKIKDDDISGDYNEYPVKESTEINNIKVVLKGSDSKSIDHYNLALWRNGKYSYSIYAENGMNKNTVQELMEKIN